MRRGTLAHGTTAPGRQAPDLWDKIWRDKDGRGDVVIYQRPNLVLIGWVVLTIASLFANGTVSTVLSDLATAALAVWALLEVFRGVNYFRRALGVVVILIIVMMLFKVGY